MEEYLRARGFSVANFADFDALVLRLCDYARCFPRKLAPTASTFVAFFRRISSRLVLDLLLGNHTFSVERSDSLLSEKKQTGRR